MSHVSCKVGKVVVINLCFVTLFAYSFELLDSNVDVQLELARCKTLKQMHHHKANRIQTVLFVIVLIRCRHSQSIWFVVKLSWIHFPDTLFRICLISLRFIFGFGHQTLNFSLKLCFSSSSCLVSFFYTLQQFEQFAIETLSSDQLPIAVHRRHRRYF